MLGYADKCPRPPPPTLCRVRSQNIRKFNHSRSRNGAFWPKSKIHLFGRPCPRGAQAAPPPHPPPDSKAEHKEIQSFQKRGLSFFAKVKDSFVRPPLPAECPGQHAPAPLVRSTPAARAPAQCRVEFLNWRFLNLGICTVRSEHIKPGRPLQIVGLLEIGRDL